ncbi:unnamed protein product [Lathyrus sativus]|nr:unnamed protein product [Lathyrus sativus]
MIAGNAFMRLKTTNLQKFTYTKREFLHLPATPTSHICNILASGCDSNFEVVYILYLTVLETYDFRIFSGRNSDKNIGAIYG